MTTTQIEISEIIGTEYGVAEEDGALVHDVIVTALQSREKIVLSFAKVAMLTTPFIRAIIGDLYERFSEQQVQSSLTVENISSDNAAVLKFVIEDIKLRLRDSQAYDNARDHALELA